MKCFVSGHLYEDIEAVKDAQVRLTKAGHEITYDWTVFDWKTKDTFSNKAEIAGKEIKAIISSDVFILLASKSEGKGMYIQLGAALTAKALKNKPTIYLIGSKKGGSIFFHHPDIKNYKNIDKLLMVLG